MNSFFIKIITVTVVLFVFAGCNKNKTTYNAFFYAKWAATDAPLSLYIDGEHKGELPYFSIPPTCSNDSLKQRALPLTLESGKYKIEAKDQKGEVRSSGTIKISKNKTSSSGNIGGQDIRIEGECAFIGVSE